MSIKKKAMVCCLLILLPGCGSREGLTLKKLQSVPQVPLWLVPIEAEIEEDLFTEYRGARVKKAGMELALKKYDYLLAANKESDRVPFWLYMSARFFLALDMDHLAYNRAERVLNLDDDTACTSLWSSFPGIGEYKHEARLIILRVLARQKLEEEFDSAMAEFTPGKSNDYFQLGQCFLLLGKNREALDVAELALKEENLESPYRKSSYTAGAVAMAYCLGEWEKVEVFSRWMMEDGRESEKYIPREKEGDYYSNQWHSSFDIVQTFRELAKKGIVPQFGELKDGIYRQSSRGFIDLIDVVLEVEKGRVKTISAENRRDDRPFSAPEIIPGRLMKANSLVIDGISSATITSTAILAGVSQALTDARG